MDEKGLKYNKRIILLRWFALAMCLVFVVCCSLPVSAAGVQADKPRNYMEFLTKSQDLGYGDTGVELLFGLSNAQTMHKAFNSSYVFSEYVTSGAIAYLPYTMASRYSVGDYLQAMVFPLGYFTDKSEVRQAKTVSLKGIPNGTGFSLRVVPVFGVKGVSVTDVAYVYIQYYDGNGYGVSGGQTFQLVNQDDYYWSVPEGQLSIPASATSFRIVVKLQARITDLSDPLNWQCELGIDELYMRMVVPTDEFENTRQQYESDKINGAIGDIGDKLDDTNDKLDDTNDKLDELPGEIGDEIQNVIDKENEKHEEEGNKFVDQLINVLPSFGDSIGHYFNQLVDVVSYEGTYATLKIPGIVIPEIPGVLPETEVWSGTELNFSNYFELLPSKLMTLVRSLFTCAIVLYGVYEVKGIVSYCLTLRENKGV